MRITPTNKRRIYIYISSQFWKKLRMRSAHSNLFSLTFTFILRDYIRPNFFFNLKVNPRRGWFELQKKKMNYSNFLGMGWILEGKFVRSGMLKREENAGPTFGTAAVEIVSMKNDSRPIEMANIFIAPVSAGLSFALKILSRRLTGAHRGERVTRIDSFHYQYHRHSGIFY